MHLPAERPELWQGSPTRARFATGRLDAEVLRTAFACRVLLEVAPVDVRHSVEPVGVEGVPVVADEPILQEKAGIDETLPALTEVSLRLGNRPGVDVTEAQRPVDPALLHTRDLGFRAEREGHDAGRQAAERNR